MKQFTIILPTLWKTKNIFDKYKVLVKYCSIPHDDRENWCRFVIQPDIHKTLFITELIDGK